MKIMNKENEGLKKVKLLHLLLKGIKKRKRYKGIKILLETSACSRFGQRLAIESPPQNVEPDDVGHLC